MLQSYLAQNDEPLLNVQIFALKHDSKCSLHHGTHCVYSLLIPFKEDVPTFLIYCYSMIDQQLLLKQFCSNRLSF